MNEKHHVKYEASAEFKAVTIVSEHKNRFKCSDVPCVGFFSTVNTVVQPGLHDHISPEKNATILHQTSQKVL